MSGVSCGDEWWLRMRCCVLQQVACIRAALARSCRTGPQPQPGVEGAAEGKDGGQVQVATVDSFQVRCHFAPPLQSTPHHHMRSLHI